MGVDTWADAPSTTEGAGWKADDAFGEASAGGWAPDTNGVDDSWNGGISDANISKHADDGFGDDAPHDGGCRYCKEDGHFARDCPNKPANSGECYNCGETGHNKADCPNPKVEREFTGNCNVCGEVGHKASACPDKPPSKCKLCQKEGHIASECTENRVFLEFAHLGIKEKSPEDAWSDVEAADKDKDVDDIKKALLTYAKAFSEVTFHDIEAVFREAGMNTYLIAKQQEVADTHTIVNLQGKSDQKYVVSIQFSAKPRRAKFVEGWPSSPEDNVARLAEAGFIMDRMVPKCDNCGELGHVTKKCPQDKVEKEKLAITCAVCNNEGHRARDCTEPRKASGKECRNCGEVGHMGKDCPNKAPDICRNCGEEGHRAKECEKERVMQCRNCDEYGHASKECPKPKDWSRVECSNCHQKGHGKARCPEPLAEDMGDGGASFDAPSGGGSWDNGGASGAGAGGGSWNDAGNGDAAGAWGSTGATSGGDGW